MFNQAIISTRFPKIGENLLIAGFRASDYEFKVFNGDKGEKLISYSGNVLACNGSVTNRFPAGRDTSMLPWPTLEVSCPSFGGMSGGPVFDSKGMLIGLLSSSYDEGPSYISLIWPALATRFEGGWPNSFFEGEKTLIDLTPQLCSIDKPSAISIVEKTNDEGSKIMYEIWE
jgi:hypothetical protein